MNGAYQQQLLGPSDADGTVSWSITAGNLPAGISLDPITGILSGTPTAAASYPFTIQLTNAFGDQFQQPLTLQVNQLALVANMLPAAYAGQVFHYTLQVAGGTPPYTFVNNFPFVIPGLPTLSATGDITYDQTQYAGTGELMFTMNDSAGASQKMVILIEALPVTLTGSQFLPDATAGIPYSYTFPASGATGPITWSISDDLSALGLTFDNTSGTLSGTPVGVADTTFTITASSAGAKDSHAYVLSIVAPPDASAALRPGNRVRSIRSSGRALVGRAVSGMGRAVSPAGFRLSAHPWDSTPD